MKLERKNYPSLAEPAGPYSHAVKHGNTLYLSGLTAFGTDAQSDNIENQAKEIFGQMQKIAAYENSNLDHIIKVTIFITELTRINELRDTLFDIYGKNLPASSLIQISGLFNEDLKIEIEAIISINY